MSESRDALYAEMLRFLDTIKRPDKQSAAIGRGENMVSAGLIDSLAIIQIVLHLEASYGISFAATGLDPEQLGTLDGILDIIEQHRR